MALEVNNLPMVMGFLEMARTFLRTEHTKKEKGDIVPNEVIGGSSTFRYRFTAARVYSTICTVGVSILEREQRFLFMPSYWNILTYNVIYLIFLFQLYLEGHFCVFIKIWLLSVMSFVSHSIL